MMLPTGAGLLAFGPLLLVEALLPVLPPLALAALVFVLGGGLSGARVSEQALEGEEARLAAVRVEAEALAETLAQIESRLAVIRQETGALALTASDQAAELSNKAEALAISAAMLVDNAGAANQSAGALTEVLTPLRAGIADLRTGFHTMAEDSAVQLRAAEALLERVHSWHNEASIRADAAIAGLAGQFNRIEEASKTSTTAMAKRSYALDAAVDGVLARTETVMDAVNERLTGTLERLDAGLDGAGRQLTLMGEEGMRLFSQRLDALIETSREMEARLAGHGSAAEGLEARLASSVETAQGLSAPMAAAAGTLDSLEAQGAALTDRITGLACELETRLASCEASVERFSAGAEALEASQARLADATADTAATLASAASGLDEGEARLAALAGALVSQFSAAKATLLDLDAAAARATDTGQRAAEGVAGRMLGLVDTIGQTEARIDEVEVRFQRRETGTLARDANRLMAGLSSSIGELAQLLQINVPEMDWRHWLRGDRSALPTLLAPLLDQDDQNRIRRHVLHDPAFRAETLRFVEQFEALIARLLGDRDGDGLAATMLSADIGKLYIRLADAAGRFE